MSGRKGRQILANALKIRRWQQALLHVIRTAAPCAVLVWDVIFSSSIIPKSWQCFPYSSPRQLHLLRPTCQHSPVTRERRIVISPDLVKLPRCIQTSLRLQNGTDLPQPWVRLVQVDVLGEGWGSINSFSNGISERIQWFLVGRGGIGWSMGSSRMGWLRVMEIANERQIS